jgi:hypothetical protein
MAFGFNRMDNRVRHAGKIIVENGIGLGHLEKMNPARSLEE